MTNRRDLRLDDEFGISKKRYRELLYFCQQYKEWQDELKYNTDTLKSPIITGMPQGTGISDKTADLATRRAELREKCELIERIAVEVDPKIQEYIIKNVTEEDVGYRYLKMIMGIPSGERQFYNARRRFFYLLDKNKK